MKLVQAFQRLDLNTDNCDMKILLTHGHYDHIGAIGDLIQMLDPVPIYIHENEEQFLIDPSLNLSESIENMNFSEHLHLVHKVKQDDVISVGSICLRVVEAPGHTPGSILFVDDANKIIFTGDVLFKDLVGNVDLKGGSFDQMKNTIEKVLNNLPDDYKFFPGHGVDSSIGYEKKNNEYLKNPDLVQFLKFC